VKTTAKLSCLVLAAAIVLLAAGCDVDRGAYDACRVGMSKQDVKSIMHIKPWLESKDTLVYEGDNVIKVQFDFDEDGKLIKKEWIDKKQF